MRETKANANVKIHVLADETLSGIKLEYVEVDRKTKVGEKIIIVDKNDPDDEYEKGANLIWIFNFQNCKVNLSTRR
ncbi:hypothetical protein G4P54_10915 [Bacillus tequilensis]|uniref:Uncharacterized protein n=1 Tax=Bacillus tequilensis TaxID=227866 RepID=A0A6H0WJA2_9BACI|nr:hypothetical protein G4P54_10915 [Bacillus tequilensis]